MYSDVNVTSFYLFEFVQIERGNIKQKYPSRRLSIVRIAATDAITISDVGWSIAPDRCLLILSSLFLSLSLSISVRE